MITHSVNTLELYKVCLAGTLAEFKKLINNDENDINFKYVNSQGNGYLHAVVLNYNIDPLDMIEMIRDLHAKNIDVNHVNNKGEHPVQYVLYSNNDVILLEFIKLNIDLNIKNNMGDSFVHIACTGSDIKMLTILTSIESVNINVQNNIGNFPIHITTLYGYIEKTLLLIERGANLECKNTMQLRPIHNICSNNNKILLQKFISLHVNLECVTNVLMRPIHYICNIGDLESLQMLINAHVNIECETIDKWRPIHFVCRYGTLDMFAVLLECKVDIECNNKYYMRPIHAACLNNSPKIKTALMDLNVDLSYNDMIVPDHLVGYNINYSNAFIIN
jgi:ankyrin repeat protein